MIKSNSKIIRWIYFVNTFLLVKLVATSCYPIDKSIEDSKLELKDETRYPNGTVVGKYSYTDNEGNPISVKYYADHSSYGVELNSFKVIKSSTTTKEALLPLPKTNIDYLKPMEPLLDLASEIMNFNHKNAGNVDFKTDTTNKYLNKPDVLTNKEDNLNHASKPTRVSSPEYETYYQNEVKAPKQCEKDKVRVYLVKDNRKIRSALEENKASTYCELF